MKTNPAGIPGVFSALIFLLVCHPPAQAQPVYTLGEVRSIDGTSNNLFHPTWGSAGVELLRRAPATYEDGTNSPAGPNRPSPRFISNVCVAQVGSKPNTQDAADFIWQWGQFIDHDLDLTESATPAEPFDISVPSGDPFFDPLATGTNVIELDRSVYRMVDGMRQQFNENTAYIDASMVYGSDAARSLELRTLDGTGRLRTSAGNLLPFNTHGFHNFLNDDDPTMFLAGDVRANEQVGLTSMHTLFVREHNFWAAHFKLLAPEASGDELYHLARAIVGAEVQHITYSAFLPKLLGADTLSPYAGYNSNVNAGIEIIFSTAGYRVGHTLLSPALLRLRADGSPIDKGNLRLREAFFSPDQIQTSGSIEPLLRGLASQRAQDVDETIVEEVRSFLFGPPGAGGFDLAALNIQRGRDHGIPTYNSTRLAYGLAPAASFSDISSDTNVQTKLALAYTNVEDVDLWVGGIAEDHVPGAMVGQTLLGILKDQFERARDGDRFWYEIYLPPDLLEMVRSQTLADIIRRNTNIGSELQADVFQVPSLPARLVVAIRDQQLRISWPGGCTDMTLQMATQLATPDWRDMPAIGNGISLDMENSARYFRLVKN